MCQHTDHVLHHIFPPVFLRLASSPAAYITPKFLGSDWEDAVMLVEQIPASHRQFLFLLSLLLFQSLRPRHVSMHVGLGTPCTGSAESSNVNREPTRCYRPEQDWQAPRRKGCIDMSTECDRCELQCGRLRMHATTTLTIFILRGEKNSMAYSNHTVHSSDVSEAVRSRAGAIRLFRREWGLGEGSIRSKSHFTI
eukprot:2433268-Rhodomonas_salina.3